MRRSGALEPSRCALYAADRLRETLGVRAARRLRSRSRPSVSRCADSPDQDLARPGGLLQARGDVDRLAGREGRVGLVDDDLAGLDRRRAPRARARARARGSPKAGAHCALGVVLVRLRDPEGGHHGVARELLDGAAVRLDARIATPSKKLVTRRRVDLRILAGSELGRPHQVGKQDRGQLRVPCINSRYRSEAASRDPIANRRRAGPFSLASRRARPQGFQGLRRARDLSRRARRGRRARDRARLRGGVRAEVDRRRARHARLARLRWPRR